MKTKKEKIEYFDTIAPERDHWKQKNSYYYEDLESFLAFLIPPGSEVLEIGCGTGDLLARLRPSVGTGMDFSPEMIKTAERKYPPDTCKHLEFVVDDAEQLALNKQYDYILLSNMVGELEDIWKVFRNLKRVTKPESRIVITYFNFLWEPILSLGECWGMKMPQDEQNWLSLDDIENLLSLNGYEVVKSGYRLLFPRYIPILSTIINRGIAKLPFIRKLCLTTYLVARPCRERGEKSELSVTVVVPCRNERGNIRPAVERIPDMGSHTEIIFVDGNSNDGTVREIEKLMKEYKGKKDIKLIHQIPSGSSDGAGHGKMLKLGKGDAVRKGFDAATGEVLMILDADLTVQPEELPKFYLALKENRGEFINGSRMVYPMEKEAMRSLNKLGNKFFSLLFTWLLDQKIRDTLCGTKVLLKRDYMKIAAGRQFFGDFDPFGDFDLLFGAARQNLKIAEVPIRYKERTYGDIKIQRFRHVLLLFRMSAIAFLRVKFR